MTILHYCTFEEMEIAKISLSKKYAIESGLIKCMCGHYGEGYYIINNGQRFMKIKVCKACNERIKINAKRKASALAAQTKIKF